MKFAETSFSNAPEILKRKLGGELIVPVTITDSTLASAGVVKAGSPINADGAIDNTADAVGILLNDVYAENPNGSLIKAFATVNLANANTNSGLTIADAVKTALPNIVFE